MSYPSMPSSSTQTPLTVAVVSRFKPAKVFKDAVSPVATSSEEPRTITSLAFDDSGEHLVTAGDDDSFKLWNCKTGKFTKVYHSKKYGIDHVRFTHTKTNILHASTRGDDAIRYHSLHDNKYLSYFKGHTDTVTSIDSNPINDTFISSALDDSVRLWDLRSPNCAGFVQALHSPVVAYDNTGDVFAVAQNGRNVIHMYPTNNFDAGTFANFTIDDSPSLLKLTYPPRPPIITALSFSPNGKHLLAITSGHVHYVLDAFSGDTIARLEGGEGLEGKREVESTRGKSGEEGGWSGDGKFVIAGSNNGKVLIWDLQNPPPPIAPPNYSQQPPMAPTIQPITTLEGHDGPVRSVRFNPKSAMLASGGRELAFWLPEREVAEGGDPMEG